MSAFGPLVSLNRGGSFIGIDATKPGDHIPYVTGSIITTGFMDRKNQALTKPDDYFKDKKALWDHITDGEEKELKLKLPGGGDNKKTGVQTPLSDLWSQNYNMLISCGTLPDVAAQEADRIVLEEYQRRVQYFSTVFPGFVEEGYDFGVLSKRNDDKLNPEINAMKAQAIEGPNIDEATLRKLKKYKKLKAKYKATKKQ